MSAYIRVASANQNITVPQYFQQSVVSATQKNVYYMEGNVGIGQAVPTSKLVVDGSTSIGYPTTAAPANGLIVSGSVGIGVSSPAVKFHVDGSMASGTPSTTQGVLRLYPGNSSAWWEMVNNGGNLNINQIGVGNRLVVNSSGYVGIGNTNPQFPLDVAGFANSPSATFVYFNATGTSLANYTGVTSVSIKSQNNIWCTSSITASSDTRIKTNIQDINDETALSQLRLLQPKTYEYIDKVQRGSDPVIGFIAQEVAEVLPRAVTKQKEIIPSIYAIAAVIDGVLTLEKEHGLVVGDKVKLIKEQDGELVTSVKEVVSAMSFTVEDTLEDANSSSGNARIFVYGKEVPDFHTLDKNAIFTIGVAAVQELDRQVQSMKSRLEALEQKLNLLINNNNAT